MAADGMGKKTPNEQEVFTMSVKVIIPAPLRQYIGKSDSVVVRGRTVEEVLRNLTSEYGELRKHLYGADGKLRSFVNIYRNEEDVRFLQREQAAVTESDVVSIVPSIAGGSGWATAGDLRRIIE